MLRHRLIYSQDRLKEEILKSSLLHGDFLLRSGQKSDYYFDKYRFESNPDLLYQICWRLRDRVPENIDYLAALEMGGIPIATVLSQMIEKPVIFVRKEAKKYGTAKLAEGPDIKGKRLCIIEDVITSGGQVIDSYKDLVERGAVIDSAMCVILRDEKGKKSLAKKHIKLYNLFDFSDLIEGLDDAKT
ncbi:hypothetical protein LCGC14_0746540 [marine sediment metagenome]|uniref:orotate phosphoribosyltransferase n=1 Tax=marine sediment metagenome TaxID=412755 RepID=A0A0F9Q9H2_9ZZZZ